jgi:hypothetical protein
MPRELQLTPATTRRFLGLSLFLQVVLAIVTIDALVFSIRNAAAVPQIQRMIDAGVGRAHLIDLPPQYRIGLFQNVIYITVFIGWLVWQHRDHRLLRHAVGPTRFTPGWAVGWWFVPFANLVRPYQVVREAASVGEGEPAVDSRLIISWWACLIFPLAVGLAISLPITLRDIDAAGISLTDAKLLRIISALTGIPSLASGILAILVVRTISKRTMRLLNAAPPRPDGQFPPLPDTPDPAAV